MNPLDFVRGCAPFDRLGPEALSTLERTLEISFFPTGTRVLERSGAKSNHLYLVRKGLAHLVREGRAVMPLEEGELFGYPSLLSQEAPAFDVVVDEDLLVYRWPAETFGKLLEYPAFAEFFTRGLAERLRLGQEEEAGPNTSLSLPVRELVTREAVLVPRDASIGQAAGVMRQHQISSVLVEGEPLGILTDRDLRNRVLAEGKGPQTPVSEVMSAPLKSLPASTPLFEALSYMVAQGIHHLPLEQDGKIIGVVSDTVFLRQQSRSPLYLLRRLERSKDPRQLGGYARELTGIAESLLQGGLGVSEIGRSVSTLGDALVRTLLKLGQEQLGTPPTPYAWMVFGSEGRMEQALLTDQDNALVYLEDTLQAKDYFARLAHWVVQGLVEAGYPPCEGGYMATRWHKPLTQWEELFRHWVHSPKPQELLEAMIFFDYRAVGGELSLEPLGQIVRQSGQQGVFLAQLAKAALHFRPPIGFFRQIREEEGGVDLKKGGIAPTVALARVYALEAGSSAKGTVERLEAAARANKLSQEGAETLREAFGFLMRLRLREQLAALKQGQKPSNKVRLESLTALERRHLKEAFLEIREMQEAMSSRFQTDRLG